MIKGTPKWNDRSTFSIQTNNGIESILKKSLPVGQDGIVHGWLETCGPTSCINVLDSLGKTTITLTPGGWAPQPEDILTLWMNDPKNITAQQKYCPGVDVSKIMANEVLEFYQASLPAVFGNNVSAKVKYGLTFEQMRDSINETTGLVIHMKNPGHYLAVVAVDLDTNEFIYRDSWPGRTKTDGFNLRMGKAEFLNNVSDFALFIS